MHPRRIISDQPAAWALLATMVIAGFAGMIGLLIFSFVGVN